jgi:hypothetical protein
MTEVGDGGNPHRQLDLEEQGKSAIQENRERQPLPNVWSILERGVKVDECYVGLGQWDFPEHFSNLREAQDYYNEFFEVRRLRKEVYEKGAPRDRLTIDLFDSITLQVGSGDPTYRYLSQAEFGQLRSENEHKSEEALRESIHEQNEYYKYVGRESGVFDDPERPSSVYGGSHGISLTPNPEKVEKEFAKGLITEEDARLKKKYALQWRRMRVEEERVGLMMEEGIVSKDEWKQLFKQVRANAYAEKRP